MSKCKNNKFILQYMKFFIKKPTVCSKNQEKYYQYSKMEQAFTVSSIHK